MILIREIGDGFFVESGEGFEFQGVDAPFSQLAFGDERLRFSEPLSDLDLREVGRDSSLPELLAERFVVGAITCHERMIYPLSGYPKMGYNLVVDKSELQKLREAVANQLVYAKTALGIARDRQLTEKESFRACADIDRVMKIIEAADAKLEKHG